MLVILFLMDVLSHPYTSLLLLIFSFLILSRKEYLIITVCIVLSGFSSLFQLHLKGNEFKVHAIHNSYTIYRQGFKKVLVWEPYEGGWGDLVHITGDLVFEENNSFKAVRGVGYTVENASVMRLKETRSFRTYTAKKLENSPLTQALVFNQPIDELPMLSSLSLQVAGLLALVKRMMRPYVRHEHMKYVELSVLIIYGLGFGFAFSILRMILQRLLAKEHCAIAILTIFPKSGNTFNFLFPFIKNILNGISNRFEVVSFRYIVPFLSLMAQGRFHIIEYLAYPVLKYLSALLSIGSLLIPKFYIISEKIISSVIWITKIRWLDRFEITGSIPFIMMLIMLVLVYVEAYKKSYLIFLISMLLLVYPPFPKVVYLDVGQGDASLIRSQWGASVTLIDTGSQRNYKQLKKKLKQQGVSRIDQIIITHTDEDHDGNVESLKRDFNVRKIIYDADEVRYLQVFDLGVEYDDINANSLLLGLNINDVQMLFTGDAGLVQEDRLIKKYPHLKVDILKLGHHGSNTSTSKNLLKNIEAKYAIASSKSKVYGHPHIEVIKKVHDQRIFLLKTDADGDISVTFTNLFNIIRTQSNRFGII